MNLSDVWKFKLQNLAMAYLEFQNRNLALKAMPTKAIIELTQNCNFKCNMCPQSIDPKFKKYTPSLNMPLEIFYKVADSIFPTTTFVDLRGFGETTILPYWPEIVDYLEKFPLIEWHLVTNLSLPRDETWRKMIRLGFVLGFSCDAATPEVFEKIRVRSRFQQILHNLDVVKNARKQFNSGGIYFISTIQSENLSEMPGLIELAAKYEVPEVQFKEVQGGQVPPLSTADPEAIKKYALAAAELAIKYKIKITFNSAVFTRDLPAEILSTLKEITHQSFSNAGYSELFKNYPEHLEQYQKYCRDLMIPLNKVSVNKKCFKPYHYTYVNYQGLVGTCNHMMYPEMLVMGDLNKQSLAQIWNSEAYQQFRKSLVEGFPTDARCKWCFENRLDD